MWFRQVPRRRQANRPRASARLTRRVEPAAGSGRGWANPNSEARGTGGCVWGGGRGPSPSRDSDKTRPGPEKPPPGLPAIRCSSTSKGGRLLWLGVNPLQPSRFLTSVLCNPTSIYLLNAYCEQGIIARRPGSPAGLQRETDSGPRLARDDLLQSQTIPPRVPSSGAPRRTPAPALLCASKRNRDCVRRCPSPGRKSPPPAPPSPTPPGSRGCEGPSVAGFSSCLAAARELRVLGAAAAARALARSIAALARRALESEAASRGGDLGEGWRRPRPITVATAPPPVLPTSREQVRGRREPAAPRILCALGLQLPTSPAAGPGAGRGRRARPGNPPTPSRPSLHSFGFPW